MKLLDFILAYFIFHIVGVYNNCSQKNRHSVSKYMVFDQINNIENILNSTSFIYE